MLCECRKNIQEILRHANLSTNNTNCSKRASKAAVAAMEWLETAVPELATIEGQMEPLPGGSVAVN
jgi:hypothetical protein